MKFLSVLVLASLAVACSSVEKKHVDQSAAVIEENVQRHPARVLDMGDIPVTSLEIIKEKTVDMSTEAIEAGYTSLLEEARVECHNREKVEYAKFLKENPEVDMTTANVFADLTPTESYTVALVKVEELGDSYFLDHKMYKNKNGKYAVEIPGDSISPSRVMTTLEAAKAKYKAGISYRAMCTIFKQM